MNEIEMQDSVIYKLTLEIDDIKVEVSLIRDEVESIKQNKIHSLKEELINKSKLIQKFENTSKEK